MNTNSLLKISWCLLLVEIIIAQAPTFKMKLEKVEKSLLVDMNLNLLEETEDLSSKWGYNTYMINNLPIPGISNPTPNKNFGQYLYNYKEVQFIGQIALGSKKKVFKVIFDSGSSALWVSTPADIYAKGKHHHTCEKQTSTTCKKGDFKSKYIGYGSGKIWGNIVSDDMWIPNVRKKSDKKKKLPETDKQLIEKIEMYRNQKTLLEKPQISDEGKRQIKGEYLSFEKNDWGHVKNQHIILVKNSPGMERNKSDGVLGIGPQDREDLESIFTNLKKQSVVDKEIFSIYQSLDEDKKPSELEIGGYDEDLVEKSGNEIVWSHIVDPKKWKVALDDVKIDGESVYAQSSLVGKFLSYFNTVMMPMYSKSFDSNKKEALIDSGTSWMVVTASDGKKYIKACKKRGIDCELKEGLLYCDRDKKSKWDAKYLPKLEYVIRGHKYAIKKELLIVECQPNDTGDGDSCLLRIRPMNWKHRILGMPFMMTNYCIFDRESKMVGIQDLGLDKAKVTDSISEKNDSSYAFMRRKVDFQRNYFKNVFFFEKIKNRLQ